ncbi:uroporphyrinogen-III C-methyltransferase, partial [Escherichia coli]|nr:uroporphyrinogen-III C-methyltransferase [Escherichia coli]
QNISMDLPETLQSQAMLEKLMQTRVRNLLAQPAAGTTAPAPAPAPAPQGDTPAAAPQGE